MLVLPLMLRGRIDGWLQAAIADRVNATVTWESASLSLFRDFPDASLRVSDLRIVGVDHFSADTLAAVPSLGLAVELPSLIRAVRGSGPLVVRSVEARQPDLKLVVLESGAANWDIMPPAEEEAASDGSLSISLQSLEIDDASVLFDNRQVGLIARIRGLDESLRGDFGQQRFAVESTTSIDSSSVRFAGIPYLSDAALALTTVLDIDAAAGSIDIREGRLSLNDLVLALSGNIAMAGDTTNLDVAFEAPNASVRELVSLISPLAADGSLSQAQTSGTASASGWVRGPLGPDAFPAFQFDAQIADGSLRYPDLPLPLSRIAVDLSLRNPGGHVDSTHVQVSRFHAAAGQSTVEGTFSMATPVSDPAVTLQAAGRMDLAEWNRALPLAAEGELGGVVEGDVSVSARASDVEAQRYERISADGTIEIADLTVRTADLPHAIALQTGRFHLSPAFAEVQTLQGTIGGSDIALNGRVDNPLGYALGDGVLRGSMDLRSGTLNLDEWKSDDELALILVPDRIDVDLTARIDRLQYAGLPLMNGRGAVRIRDRRATLDDFTVDVFGGSLAVGGFYETVDPAKPAFDVEVRLASVDVAEAAAGLEILRTFAPITQYASGRFTTDVRLSGILGENMAPMLEILSGQGMVETDRLSLQGFPGLTNLADRLRTAWLSEPTMRDITASFQILDGRLHVRPFDVALGDFTTRVAGSQGIDQSMDYVLEMLVPRAVLGAAANEAVASLASRIPGGSAALAGAEEIALSARLTGTVREPNVALDFKGAGSGDVIRAALQQAAAGAVGEMEARADSVAAAARLRAEEEAARIIAEAERQAEAILEEARALAEAARAEGHAQADALAARGGNVIEQQLARTAADRLRTEADQRADGIISAAETRANQLVETARARAEETRGRQATPAP